MKLRLLVSVLGLLLVVRIAASQVQAPVLPSPDDRYKADLLLVWPIPMTMWLSVDIWRASLSTSTSVLRWSTAPTAMAAETLWAMRPAHLSVRCERSRHAAR